MTRGLHTGSERPISQEVTVREPCPRCGGTRFRFYPDRRRWWLAICVGCNLEVDRDRGLERQGEADRSAEPGG